MSLMNIEHRAAGPVGGAALGATAGLAWGAMFPIAKHGMRHVDALHMTSIRYVLASLGFLALLAAREGRSAIRFDGRAVRLLVLGSIGFAGFNLLSYVGLGMTRPQNASLVVATMPFIALLVVRVRMGAKLARRKLALMAVGFVGVGAVITRGDVGDLVHGGVGGGEGLVLAGVVCWVLAIAGGYAPNGYELGGALVALASLMAVTALNRASAPSRAAAAGTSASGAPIAAPLRARLPRRLARTAASR